jgi:hypothetical protein
MSKRLYLVNLTSFVIRATSSAEAEKRANELVAKSGMPIDVEYIDDFTEYALPEPDEIVDDTEQGDDDE